MSACPISIAGLPCIESPNPRLEGKCFRCGKPMPKPEVRRRDLDFERELTRHASRGAVEPSALIEHAETRSLRATEYVKDPMTLRVGVDWIKEAKEEGADMRNDITWWLEENRDDPTAQDKVIALRFLCLAYDRLLDDD